MKVIDFDLIHFCNIEAEINYPEEKGIVQVCSALRACSAVSGTYIMYCLRTDIGCGELSLDACAMSGTDLSYGLLWPFALAMGCPVLG